MQRLRDSSFVEYGTWFWQRELRNERPLDKPIPSTDSEMEALFKTRAPGKYRPWFRSGRWSVGRLTLDEFKHLMVLDAVETRSEQLVIERVNRTLENAAKNALATGYFEVMRPLRRRHFWYFLSYVYGSLRLEGENRLVVCSLSPDETRGAPDATYSYYLHDGWGRALPYMVLVLQGEREYEPVEVVCVEKV
jgi:hypothetical protein